MKKLISRLKLIIISGLLLVSFLSIATVQASKQSCPAPVQKGELTITIPAGALSGMTEVPVVRCEGMNLQATAGMMLQVPVLTNGVVHHDSLILTVYLMEPEPGPVDVTVWWRID